MVDKVLLESGDSVGEGDLVELDGKVWSIEWIRQKTPEEAWELYVSGRALLPQYQDKAILTSTERVQEIRMGRERTLFLPRQVTISLTELKRDAVRVRSHRRMR